MTKPILCVDFDGVIHSYISGWKGEAIVADPPVKGALNWLWEATEFWNVQVYSSRSKTPGGMAAMRIWFARECAIEFDMDHPMNNSPFPITFAAEKPAAFLTIDDRAICFDGDWSAMDPAALLAFKPWNKREVGDAG